MSEKYLEQPEPERADLTTPSLTKYKYAIDQWGGWALFQVCLPVGLSDSKMRILSLMLAQSLRSASHSLIVQLGQ